MPKNKGKKGPKSPATPDRVEAPQHCDTLPSCCSCPVSRPSTKFPHRRSLLLSTSLHYLSSSKRRVHINAKNNCSEKHATAKRTREMGSNTFPPRRTSHPAADALCHITRCCQLFARRPHICVPSQGCCSVSFYFIS